MSNTKASLSKACAVFYLTNLPVFNLHNFFDEKQEIEMLWL